MNRRLKVMASANLPKLFTQSLQAHGAVDGIIHMFPIFVARVVDQIRPLRPPFVDQPQVSQYRLAGYPLSVVSVRLPGSPFRLFGIAGAACGVPRVALPCKTPLSSNQRGSMQMNRFHGRESSFCWW